MKGALDPGVGTEEDRGRRRFGGPTKGWTHTGRKVKIRRHLYLKKEALLAKVQTHRMVMGLFWF